MSRVEWTRRTPEEIEAVLGIMLCREYPNAQRVRPARGDNGIDVYVPFEDGWVVFQVKSFTNSLTSSHKRQITKSWIRFRDYAKAKSLKVKAWYVVRPLNPTQPEIEWLAELTAGAGFACEWRGFSFCEGLVAKYPDVVDYYLFDGRERLQDVVRTLLAATGWSGGTETNPFRPSDAYPTLESLHSALNAFDPHYYFDFSVSTVIKGQDPPKPEAEPGLVAASIRVADGRAVTFLIFARFREATIERPVPGSFTVNAEPGSPEAAAWKEFLAYGTPVEELAVSRMSLELPGGLGADATDGFINLGPASPETARPFTLTVEVLEADSSLIAATDVSMKAATVGLDGKGIATTGIEVAGVFDLGLRVRLDGDGLKVNLAANDLTGRRPAEVLAGLDVLLAFGPRRLLSLRLKDGPQLAEPETIVAELPGQPETRRIRRVCAALAEIQRHTLQPIKVPDLTLTTNNEARAWLDAAQLLTGQTLLFSWNEASYVVDDTGELPAIGSVVPLTAEEPLRVLIEGRELELGRVLTVARSAQVAEVDMSSRLVRVEPANDDTIEIRLA